MSESGGAPRPSLLALLTKLSDPSVTTPDQRFAIRSIVADYLENNLSHVKVFAYLGQVLTHSFLADIIQELTEELKASAAKSEDAAAPGGAAPPADQPSGETKQAVASVVAARGIPQQQPSNSANAEQPPSSHGEQQPPTTSAALSEPRKERALFFRSLASPLRWIWPHSAQSERLLNPGCQAALISNCARVLFVGGHPVVAQVPLQCPSPSADTTRPSTDPDSTATLPPSDGDAVPVAMADAGEKPAGPLQTDHTHGAASTALGFTPAAPSAAVNLSSSSTAAVAAANAAAARPNLSTFQTMQTLDCRTLQRDTIEAFDGPRAAAGHSVHQAIFSTGPAIIVYGGCCPPAPASSQQPPGGPPAGDVTLLGSVWALDEESLEWVLLDVSSALLPPPRHSHASVLVQAQRSSAAVGSTAGGEITHTEHLIIFGGVGLPGGWDATSNAQRMRAGSTVAPVERSCAAADLTLLDDVWSFSFQTGQWTEHSGTGGAAGALRPSARCGCQFAAASDSCAVLYGGQGREGRQSTQQQQQHGNRRWHLPMPSTANLNVMQGTWILTWKLAEEVCPDGGVRSELTEVQWTKGNGVGPPRAWYAALSLVACIVPTAKGERVRCFSQATAEADERLRHWAAHQVIVLLGGVADDCREMPGVLLGLVLPTSDRTGYDVVWRAVPDIALLDGQGTAAPFRSRVAPTALLLEPPALALQQQQQRLNLQRHSLGGRATAAATEETEEVLAAMAPPEDEFAAVTRAPCALVAGGWCPASGVAKQDFWLLRLSNLNPVFLCSAKERLRVAEHRLLMGMILSGVSTTPDLVRYLQTDPASPRKQQLQQPAGLTPYDLLNTKAQELRLLASAWHHPGRDTEPEILQSPCAANSGIFWSLASLVRHPFSCIAHLIENPLVGYVKAKHVHVAFERWRGHDCLTVTDDGRGLNHQDLHQLLRSFGHQPEGLGGGIPSSSAKYGLGFKLAVGRLAYNVLVLTHATGLIGAGLLSLPLNRGFQAASVIAPVCFWNTRDGMPYCSSVEEPGFGMSFATIVANSPLGTAQALEEELLKFKDGCGTRIIFFGLRKDTAGISPLGALEQVAASTETPRLSDATICLEAWLPSAAKLNTELEETQSGSRESVAHQTGSHPPREPSLLPSPPRTRFPLLTQVALPPFEWSSDVAAGTILPPIFPLWTAAEHSPDYNLLTYMFWSQLHSEAELTFNGIQLLPQQPQMSDDATDDDDAVALQTASQLLELAGVAVPRADVFANSLWRFLQRKLRYKLEMPYLFDPKFGDEHFYGLVGKLGPPACEAGVLLYYNGRLINRALLPMPMPRSLHKPQKEVPTSGALDVFTSRALTAVINVPDFLLPRATKEGFLQDGEERFQWFYDRLETELREWVRVHTDAAALAGLQQRYTAQFDKWRHEAWQGQHKKSRKQLLR